MRYSAKIRHQLHWLLVAIYTGIIGAALPCVFVAPGPLKVAYAVIAILAAVFGTVALTMALRKEED